MAAKPLTYAELKGVWLQASKGTKYHTNHWASLMAAIAEAESGGRPDAKNPTDNNGTQTSWGLWQISNGTHSQVSPNWADPVTNAKLAIGKLNSQGLTAWGTYDSGAYKRFLSPGTSPAPPPGGGGTTQAQTTAAATACVIQFPGVAGLGATCLFSKGNARAVIGGLALAAGSMVFFAGVAILAAEGFRRTGMAKTFDSLATRIDAPFPKIERAPKAPKQKPIQAPKGAVPPGKPEPARKPAPAKAPAPRETAAPAPAAGARTAASRRPGSVGAAQAPALLRTVK